MDRRQNGFIGLRDLGNPAYNRGMWRIRECTEADFEPILVLLRQLWPTMTLDRTNMHGAYRRALASEAYLYLCAEEEGRIVGFCSLSYRENLRAGGPMTHIEEMVVDASCRGQGIGKALLRRAVHAADERGCSLIELDSALHRAEAHEFYRLQGFQKDAWHFTQLLFRDSGIQ